MLVQQVYSLVNSITQQTLGESAVVAEDLSNIVDIGNAVFNQNQIDNYVRNLVNHIGKVTFDSKVYSGKYPTLLMESWEFGSVLQKVRMKLPTANENDTWDLQDGTSYDPNVFYKPNVTAKFFNSKVTFEIPISITERQVKESFSNVEQLNGFISMIYSIVERSMTVKIDGLIQRAINNFVGQTAHAANANTYVNLLSEYNTLMGTTLQKEQALTNKDFLKYVGLQIGLYTDRLQGMSTLFNLDSYETFTPKENLSLILLSNLDKAFDSYLLADTYNFDKLVMPENKQIIPFWQGSGMDFSFDSVSTIDVSINVSGTVTPITVSGVVGVIFDKYAIGVANTDRRVTTNYNAKAEFFNNYFKYDCQFYNDFSENFVVFYIA